DRGCAPLPVAEVEHVSVDVVGVQRGNAHAAQAGILPRPQRPVPVHPEREGNAGGQSTDAWAGREDTGGATTRDWDAVAVVPETRHGSVPRLIGVTDAHVDRLGAL